MNQQINQISICGINEVETGCMQCMYWASLNAQLVKNPPAKQETPAWFLDWEDPLEGIGYPLWCSWASLVAQLVKNRLQCWRPGFDPWVGRSPGERNVYPLQYSALENSFHWLYSSWGHKESDTTEWTSLGYGSFSDFPCSWWPCQFWGVLFTFL